MKKIDDILQLWKERNSIPPEKADQIKKKILEESYELDYKWWIKLFSKSTTGTINQLNVNLKKSMSMV